MSETETKIRCGPFELFELLGKGGMGEVWRARHVRDDRPAAIKVLLAERAQEPGYQRAFRREAHALARLNHPAIATIYDYGWIGAEAASRGPDAFIEGAPWLAMEYVDGEAIGEVRTSWTWSGLRAQLSTLLDALAHAHAQHVLHRDLKPSNVLVRSDGGLRVVDFGVAAVLRQSPFDEEEEVDRTIRGTPSYMAPEQIRGEWRSQGPWTDLYAVGCIAWRIVCGTPPIKGETTEEVLRRHLVEGPSEYRPIFDVPPELQFWLERLLARSPRDRFRRAADAAWYLASMPEIEEVDEGAVPETRDEETLVADYGPTLLLPTPGDSVGSTAETVEVEPPTGPREPGASALDATEYPGEPPPIPPRWERGHAEVPEPLSASGVELFGARRLPTVDRRDERDALWSALREVASSEEPGAVLLEGPAGSGKSQLTEWLRCRAEETGAAIGIRVDHSPTGGPAEGIEAALVRHFRLGGLSGSDAVQRLTRRLESMGLERNEALYDAFGIVGSSGLSPSTHARRGFENRRERHFALRRVLRALAAERPILLWIDDIPWGRESVQFVDFLFEGSEASSLPLLVAMTARRRALEAQSDVRSRVASALSAAGGRTIEIDPLAAEDQRAMLRRMLRFDEDLVDELVERTEGRPLFAVQLVTDWLERGVLEADGDGFVVTDSERPAMPSDLNALWMRRLEEVVERYPDHQRDAVWRALEQAAAFGRHVDEEEWGAALRCQEEKPPLALGSRLVEAGLARPAGAGWRFVHGLAVEALADRAREEGRFVRHQRNCAAALADLYPEREGATAERRADHYLEAGEQRRALELLFRAARWVYDRGDFDEHLRLIDRCEEIIERLGLPAEDGRRIQLQIQRGASGSGRGELDASAGALEEALERAKDQGDDRLRGRAALALAYNLRMRGDAAEALRRVDEAERLLDRVGEPVDLARCLECRAAILWRLRQEYGEARELFERARARYEAIGHSQRILLCDYIFACIEYYRGDLECAEERGREVLERASSRGDRYREASVYNLLGEIARRRGRSERAREWYGEARRLWESCGARDAAIPALNVAMMAVYEGDFDRAEPELLELEEVLEDSGLGARLAPVHLGLAACRAVECDWEEVDHWIEVSRRHFEEYDYRMADQAEMAERAAEVVGSRGGEARAEQLESLASLVWQALEEE